MLRYRSVIILLLVLIVGAVGFHIYANREQELPPLPPEYKDAVTSALDRSGENRKELVKALADVPEDQLPAMCDMISRMPRHDLANITSKMLLDHVDCTFAVMQKVPWKIDTDSKIFLDYVLPHRISCESLENSRRRMMKLVYPKVKKCQTAKEAVAKALKYLRESKVAEMNIGTTYPFDYTPFASWKYAQDPTGWGCRARSLLGVAILRSVGIPARVMDRPTSQYSATIHTVIYYYDAVNKQWYIIEATDSENDDEAVRQMSIFGEAALYTNPPYMSFDPLSKKMYDKMEFIGLYKFPSSTLKITTTSNGSEAADVKIGVYVWDFKLRSWYLVAVSTTNRSGHVELMLGSNNRFRPYMISAVKGRQCAMSFISLKPGEIRQIGMNLNESDFTYAQNIRALAREL